MAEGSKGTSSRINFSHPYQGLAARERSKKINGGIGEKGESSLIAGDSVFVSTLGTVSQTNLAQLAPNNIGLLILGSYQYCDELGTLVSRTFGLRYTSHTPTTALSFDLAMESGWLPFRLPDSTAEIEYLPPCETISEK
jgi:hypothetical protein